MAAGPPWGRRKVGTPRGGGRTPKANKQTSAGGKMAVHWRVRLNGKMALGFEKCRMKKGSAGRGVGWVPLGQFNVPIVRCGNSWGIQLNMTMFYEPLAIRHEENGR